MSDNDKRTECIDGLRQLADFIEAHPEFPVPMVRASVYFWGGTAKAELATAARTLGAALKEADDFYIGVTKTFAGLTLLLRATRSDVCERVVVGTRTETFQVPPAGVEMIQKTRTVELVEWVCPPSILALAEDVPA